MFAFLTSGPQVLTLLSLGFIISFVLSMGVGGNDVANFFGTSVGTKTLTLVQVIIIASIFELSGVMLLGMRVSDTIRKGIIKIEDVVHAYDNSTTCLKPFVQDLNNTLVVPDNYRGCSEMITMISSFSALVGSAVWLTVANIFKMPVSTTHSIVGATVGAGLVALEGSSISWPKVTEIVLSWVVSPILSGLVSFLLYIFIYKLFLKKENSFKLILRTLPAFYFITIFINLFSIFYEGTPMLGFDKIPLWGVFILSGGVGVIVVLLTIYVFNPIVVRRIEKRVAKESFDTSKTPNTLNRLTIEESDDPNKAEREVYEMSNQNDVELNIKHKTPTIEESTSSVYQKTNHSDANRSSVNNLIDKSDDDPALKIKNKAEAAVAEAQPTGSDDVVEREAADVRTSYLFHILQILMACFGSFVHGGNDISNSISPLMTIWLVYNDGALQAKSTPPPWLLFYGAVGILVGLGTIGYRVISTIGKNITKIAPSSAFCIEFGSAFSVLVATRIGLPVSTTHCQIGSVVAVGLYRNGRKSLNKRLLLNIAFSWIITLPFAGLVSAATFSGIRYAIMTVNVPAFPTP